MARMFPHDEDRNRRTSCAPVALFAFARPMHLQQTLAALAANHHAAQTELFVFCDGPRRASDAEAVAEVRAIARGARGFARVEVIERERNLGLAQNIIDGVTRLCDERGRVIVLEDDLVSSPYFLRYMNDALDRYADEPRVASIHAYTLPVKTPLPETFFLRGADCWGWATWKRAWAKFNPDGKALLAELKRRGLLREFDFNDSGVYSTMLEQQIRGKNNSWAVRWYASAFLADMLTLHPGRSLVDNIGTDGTGTHRGETTTFGQVLASTPVEVRDIELVDCRAAREAYEAFHRDSARRGQHVRALMREWMPPPLTRFILSHRKGSRIVWEPATSWEHAKASSVGYDDDAIFERVRIAAGMVKRGQAAYERDSVVFHRRDYVWPVLAALMMAAARDGSLRVLDFGGSLGSTYFQHRDFLAALRELKWGVVEKPRFVRHGNAELADEQLAFFETIEACAAAIRPNVVLASGVLQYLDRPFDVLRQLVAVGTPVLVIDRTPFSAAPADQPCIQRVPPTIHAASYPMWIFSRRRFALELGQEWKQTPFTWEGTEPLECGDTTFTLEGLLLTRHVS